MEMALFLCQTLSSSLFREVVISTRLIRRSCQMKFLYLNRKRRNAFGSKTPVGLRTKAGLRRVRFLMMPNSLSTKDLVIGFALREAFSMKIAPPSRWCGNLTEKLADALSLKPQQ